MTQKQIEFSCPKVFADQIEECYEPLGFATKTEMIRHALRKFMEDAGIYRKGVVNAK